MKCDSYIISIPSLSIIAVSILLVLLNNSQDDRIVKDKFNPPDWLRDLLLNVSLVQSDIITRQESRYQSTIKVYNGECVNKPDAIVVAGSPNDVAKIIKFVGDSSHKIDLSVRSGGHSYGCTSSRVGGLQLDMRGLSQIELIQTKSSKTGWAARLGPGATWDKVLEVIPPDKWTVVHGQCLGVGVGGFTLGGGVNMVGSTTRYGAAMEQVIEYEMVTAEGEQVRVTEERVEMLQQDGTWSELEPSDPRHNTDLLFGLRGAGASFGVVTQFLVTVYPSPETLASVIPVFVSNDQDLARIQTLAHSDQGRGYQFGLYSLYYPQAVRSPWWHPVLAMSQHMMRLQSWVAGEQGSPMVLSVADIRSTAGRSTNTTQVITMLTQAGVRLAISSPSVLDAVSQQAGALGMMDYEGEYLTERQRLSEGPQGLVSANMGGIEDVTPMSGLLLDDAKFGNKHKFSREALDVGCNYCFWAINFLSVGGRSKDARLSLTRDVGKVQMEMTCMYSTREANNCKKEVEFLRRKLLGVNIENGGKDSQYVNTPSCQQGDWTRRYFGDNYSKLLLLKKAWDPKNLFNYCQSIGNDDRQAGKGNCCQI